MRTAKVTHASFGKNLYVHRAIHSWRFVHIFLPIATCWRTQKFKGSHITFFSFCLSRDVRDFVPTNLQDPYKAPLHIDQVNLRPLAYRYGSSGNENFLIHKTNGNQREWNNCFSSHYKIKHMCCNLYKEYHKIYTYGG